MDFYLWHLACAKEFNHREIYYGEGESYGNGLGNSYGSGNNWKDTSCGDGYQDDDYDYYKCGDGSYNDYCY